MSTTTRKYHAGDQGDIEKRGAGGDTVPVWVTGRPTCWTACVQWIAQKRKWTALYITLTLLAGLLFLQSKVYTTSLLLNT